MRHEGEDEVHGRIQEFEKCRNFPISFLPILSSLLSFPSRLLPISSSHLNPGIWRSWSPKRYLLEKLWVVLAPLNLVCRDSERGASWSACEIFNTQLVPN